MAVLSAASPSYCSQYALSWPFYHVCFLSSDSMYEIIKIENELYLQPSSFFSAFLKIPPTFAFVGSLIYYCFSWYNFAISENRIKHIVNLKGIHKNDRIRNRQQVICNLLLYDLLKNILKCRPWSNCTSRCSLRKGCKNCTGPGTAWMLIAIM